MIKEAIVNVSILNSLTNFLFHFNPCWFEYENHEDEMYGTKNCLDNLD
jgi:hypothetical protein